MAVRRRQIDVRRHEMQRLIVPGSDRDPGAIPSETDVRQLIWQRLRFRPAACAVRRVSVDGRDHHDPQDREGEIPAGVGSRRFR